MPSLEEYKKLFNRLGEIYEKKEKEGSQPAGSQPGDNIHNELMKTDEEYKSLYNQYIDYDSEISKQFFYNMRVDAQEAEERRQAHIKANNGFGGRRRRTKKSKRKHRKTRRR
jgi:hypothetical protein